MVKRVKNILISMIILLCLIIIPSIAMAGGIVLEKIEFNYSYYVAVVILVVLVGARGIFAIYELNKITNLAKAEIENARQAIKNPSDSSWIYENLMSRVKICIYKFNEALEKRDISIAKGYVSEKLEKKLNEKINRLIENNQKQLLPNYKIIKLLPVKAVDDLNNEKDFIKIAIQIETFDYLIDCNVNRVVEEDNVPIKVIEKTWSYIKIDGFWVADEIEDFELEINDFI